MRVVLLYRRAARIDRVSAFICLEETSLLMTESGVQNTAMLAISGKKRYIYYEFRSLVPAAFGCKPRRQLAGVTVNSNPG